VQARSKDVDSIRKGYEEVKEQAAKLEKTLDDPEINLAVGKFRCWLKGSWEKGLPLLARGSNARLQAQAEKDLAAPTEAVARVQVADGWWDLAQVEQGIAKMHLLQRARYWYEQAVPELTGLTKARVEKRLQELDKLTEGHRLSEDWLVIFRSADPSI